MEYKRFGNTLVLRLDSGDEIMGCLRQVCRREDVRFGTISGLGALSRMKVGVFDTANKTFLAAEYHSMFEIVSLTGNITEKDGEPYLHCHMAAAYEEGVVVGGHLDEAEVSATAEIFITRLEGGVGRAFSPDIGLNLLDFGGGT